MNRDIRVLSVQHYPEFGGPHNEILKLESALNSLNVSTVVAITDQPGNALERLTDRVTCHAIPLHRFRAHKNPLVNLKAVALLPADISALRRIIRSESIDVVKVHGPHNPQGALAAHMENKPIVWVLSSTRPSPIFRRLGMIYVRRMANSLLVNGPSLRDWYPGSERLGDQTFYYYPPVDTDRFSLVSEAERAEARSALGLPIDAPIVGTVANINPQKGIEFFIKTAHVVRQRYPNARFVVAGGVGPAQESYFERVKQEAIELGLFPTFLSFLGARTDVQDVLAAFDVKVISSVAEGTTATAGEAMARGIPVVAANVGAVKDVVEHSVCGLLVPPRDTSAMADAILNLLEDPDRRQRFGIEGRRLATAKLSAEASAESHCRAYKAAISRHRHRENTAVRNGCPNEIS